MAGHLRDRRQDGTQAFRVGFAVSNEFSDHVTERINYLYLAHSKLRQASFGPEIRVGAPPAGYSRHVAHPPQGRGDFWEKPFLSGEANMSHTFANLEYHHFKYGIVPCSRAMSMSICSARPRFPSPTASRPKPGDVFEIEAAEFGLALRNTLAIAAGRRDHRPAALSCRIKSESDALPKTACANTKEALKPMTLHQNLIAGEWVGTDGVDNINPSNTNEVVGVLCPCERRRHARNAIAAAKAAFPAWSRSGILERHAILKKTSDEILARKEELGKLLAREEGKTLPEAIGEVIRAAQIFDFFAGEVLRLAGEVLPSVRPNIGVEITREPIGVVGIITPWNFPIAIPAWKIAPALCLRQHGRLQAGRTGSGLLLGDRRYSASRRPAEGRAQPRHGQGLGRRPGHAR